MSTSRGAPPHLPELIGREMELADIQGRLQDASVRLVTLTGPGGVGKSRLAQEAARSLAAEFPGGVRSVDLAAVEDPAAAPDAAARALAGPAAPPAPAPGTTGPATGPATGSAPASCGRELVVLDGIEHLTGRLAPLVARSTTERPQLTVLATGQETLRIYGEQLVPVAPLAPPGELPEPDVADVQDNPAVQLFVRRAHEVNPEFALTAENVEETVAICNLLEGVPLMLELAARRLRLFPVRELHAWLQRGGDSRLPGLVGVPERQSSVLAVADWSCRGLDERQRSLLAWLSVFESGTTLAAAEKISPLSAAETVEATETLLDRHLISLEESPGDGNRLVLSRTLRTFGRAALEESGETDAARTAHARYHHGLLRGLEGRFHGSEQRRWLHAVAVEHDNVHAALRHLHDSGDLVAQAELTAACLRPWLVRGELKDGLHWFDSTAQELRDRRDDDRLALLGRLHDGAGCLAAALGDHDGAARRHRLAVAVYRQLRDSRRAARASTRMGLALFRCGDRAVGRSLLTASRTTLEDVGDTAGSAEAAAGLAEVLIADGKHEDAKGLLDRAEQLYRQSGEIRDLARTRLLGARLALLESDGTGARTALREALDLFGSLGERTELPTALEDIALLVHSVAGRPQRAARLLGAADALRRRTGTRLPDARWNRIQETVTDLRSRLGWNVFGTTWVEGLRLGPAALAAEAGAALSVRRSGERGEPASLTARQLQVAMLVAEGMTNRQIAHHLHIAEWTVVNHVRHVMRKLDCHSRVQVAWAVGRRQR